MNKLTIRAAAARQKMTDVRTKGLRRSLQEDGAIDLASIMVGVLVIGIVGGVIAATVFAVIPWSLDQAASQALDSVATAESVAFAQSSGEGAGVYLDDETLATSDGLGGTEGLIQASEKIQIVLGADAKSYTAFSLSDTGNVFSATSADPSTAVETKAAAAEAFLAGFDLEILDGKLVETTP